MVSLAIDPIAAIVSMPLSSMIMLVESLRIAVVMPHTMLRIMVMCADLSSCLPDSPVALAVEAAFDLVTGPVEYRGKGIVPVCRSEQGKTIELQIDQSALLVEAPVFSTGLADAAWASADIMACGVCLSHLAIVVMASMTIPRLCAAGEYEPPCEDRTDCPVLPIALFHRPHLRFLRAVL